MHASPGQAFNRFLLVCTERTMSTGEPRARGDQAGTQASQEQAAQLGNYQVIDSQPESVWRSRSIKEDVPPRTPAPKPAGTDGHSPDDREPLHHVPEQEGALHDAFKPPPGCSLADQPSRGRPRAVCSPSPLSREREEGAVAGMLVADSGHRRLH